MSAPTSARTRCASRNPLARTVAYSRSSLKAFCIRSSTATSHSTTAATSSAENKALGAQTGSVVVPWLDYAREGNFGALELGTWTQGETVPLVTLDSYALNTCHLIKIDVEGMERDVLEGARATITRHQPLLYVENNKRERSKALIEWLLTNRYRPYWHLPPLFNPKNYFGETKNVFGITISANMLCVPKSKPSRVEGLREITSPDDRWYSD